MSLHIEQSSSYLGKDRWAWRAWVAGEPGELAALQRVTWYLHPSFSPSVVASTDAASGFALQSSGWGTFELRAVARRHDGTETELRHELALSYPDEADPVLDRRPRSKSGRSRASQGPMEASGKRVFLSYGSEDRAQAAAVRASLETLGATVVDESAAAAGAPLQVALHTLLSACDQVVAVLSSPVPSQWVAEELSLATRLGKPVLLLKGAGVASLHGVPDHTGMQTLTLGDAAQNTAALAAFLNR